VTRPIEHEHRAPERIVPEWIAFGPFVLHLRRRTLSREGKRVGLNPRAITLLTALIQRPGEVLSKEELMARIWPDRTVEEVNLRVAVTALRQALGQAEDGGSYVSNAVGRGYFFSASVTLERWPPRPEGAPGASASTPLVQGRLPMLLKPVIGRDQVIARIAALLAEHRLVTIVGPAGIGKTTAAISTASRTAHAEAVCFVDLAQGREPGLVLSAVAHALNLPPALSDPFPAVIAALADQSTLLIFDNCEHVLGAVADLAEHILQQIAGLRILATSREAIRIDGEAVYRLEALDVPDEAFEGGAEDALRHSAVQLLVERIQASNHHFVLSDDHARAAAEICRRLDGIALAIQLAAGRVAAFGLAEVASRLDDRFRFLSQGSRTALPRHQTLDAAVSWSFELLTANERIVCERLSIFSGEFSLDAAIDVAGWAPVPAVDVPEILATLVDKSLIVFVADPARPRYVFLEMIRDFARSRYRIFDTDDELFRRLAQRLASECERFFELAALPDRREATEIARRLIDDLRYAVRRALEMGDPGLLTPLVTKAAPVAFHLGAVVELKTWLEHALSVVVTPRERLPLLMHLAQAIHWSRPNPARQLEVAAEAVPIADDIGDARSGLQARWVRTIAAYAGRQPELCLVYARDLRARASAVADESAETIGHCLEACALHDLAEYVAAGRILRTLLETYPPARSAEDASRFGLNHRTVALCALGSIAWQTGRNEEVTPYLEEAAREANGHLPSLFIAESHILSLTMVEAKDWSATQVRGAELEERFGINARWKAWLANLSAVAAVHSTGSPRAFEKIEKDILSGDWIDLTNRAIWIVLPVIECCLIVGRNELAASLADKLVQELRTKKLRWLLPEALRLQAVTAAPIDNALAQARLREAATLAGETGAIAYAARISTTLGEMQSLAATSSNDQ